MTTIPTPHTNAHILARAITDADTASTITIRLAERCREVLGDDSPVTKSLEEANQLLAPITELVYGFTGKWMKELSVDELRQWAADPSLTGPCETCAHRREPEHEALKSCHACAISQGVASPGYECPKWQAKQK